MHCILTAEWFKTCPYITAKKKLRKIYKTDFS
jgi:hypothetical protein